MSSQIYVVLKYLKAERYPLSVIISDDGWFLGKNLFYRGIISDIIASILTNLNEYALKLVKFLFHLQFSYVTSNKSSGKSDKGHQPAQFRINEAQTITNHERTINILLMSNV